MGHKRHEMLQASLNMWAETIPGYRWMVVIANHPTTLNGIVLPDRAVPVQTGRVSFHAGCLSESWNMGLLWTFGLHPDTEWVILSQDDVKITPGWLEVVNAYDADSYNAPAGDMVMLINRRAFREVGWFDEHIRTIGGQDMDWIARAVAVLGQERVVSEDYHGWRYNPIGLEAFWESAKGKATPGASYYAGGDLDTKLKAHMLSKWGISTVELKAALIAHAVPKPVREEYAWYPWCVR